jgi:aminoglycoside phosphotransferase (APT) family kinase protein
VDERHEPWRSEVALDEALVLELVTGQFPDLGAGEVRYLHQGWDSRAYLVDVADDTVVFRFPKRAEVDGWLRAELEILRALAPLDLPLAIPRPEWIGRPGPRFPFRFMGYRLIVGAPGDAVDVDAVDQASLAASLGAFLGVLHTRGTALVAGAEIRGHDDEASPLAGMLAEARAVAREAFEVLPEDLRTVAAEFIERGDLPAAVPFGCLVHDDLTPEHLLVDPAGHLVGLIDWGDASIGDPAADFAGVYAWLGGAAAESMLVHYRSPRDPAFWDRVVFRARCYAVIGLGWSVRGGGEDVASRVAMAWRAFA